jgi:iron-sulfur cluster insertion protein
MNLTESAVEKLRDILAEDNNPNLKLRVFVQGGGCSGFSYGFTLDEEQNEDDFDLAYGNVKVLVDSMSWQYLQNSEINYKEDLAGASFVINNPQAVSTCGCGSSFSVSYFFSISRNMPSMVLMASSFLPARTLTNMLGM